MTIPKELRDVAKECRKMGLVVHERSNGNHYKVTTQDGKYLLSLPSSPGRGRWKKNLMAELRRKGVTTDVGDAG